MGSSYPEGNFGGNHLLGVVVADLGVPSFGVVGVHGGRGSDTGLLGHARRRPTQNTNVNGELGASSFTVVVSYLSENRPRN